MFARVGCALSCAPLIDAYVFASPLFCRQALAISVPFVSKNCGVVPYQEAHAITLPLMAMLVILALPLCGYGAHPSIRPVVALSLARPYRDTVDGVFQVVKFPHT